jgi:uncharacterized membrane protein
MRRRYVRASTTVRSTLRLVGRLSLLPLVLVTTGVAAAPALAAGTLTLTTPYPAVVVSPGGKVSFDIKVKSSVAARVDLQVLGTPAGWDATLQGGGFVIDAVATDGKTATDVTLSVSVPASATGTTHLTVRASGAGQTVDLGLDLRVSTSGGELTLTTDVPSLKDAATATFTFNLMIHNDTPQDETFVANAQGPTGWTISSRLSGLQQAASSVVKAGTTATVTVTAQAPDGTPAGQYPIDAVVTVGDKQLTQKLTVEITGSYTLALSTPSQVLSNRGTAGAATEQQITVTNNGSAEVTNVKVTASAPTNWKVDFDNATIASIAAGASTTVTARITPSSDAIAGDYQITFRAASDQNTSATEDIRFTVETSILWAIVGALLIVAVFAGLWWVFRRYGRR